MTTKRTTSKLTNRAAALLIEINEGRDRVFYMTDVPCGWAELERKGYARRHATDANRATITEAGCILAEQITPDTL